VRRTTDAAARRAAHPRCHEHPGRDRRRWRSPPSKPSSPFAPTAGALADVTLVADTDAFAYRALQIGEGDPRRYQLAPLVEGAGGRFVRASISSISAGARELVLDSGRRIPYDAPAAGDRSAHRHVPRP
jgi:hypothetical protein